MRTLVLALSALSFLAVTVPMTAHAAPPRKSWMYKGHKYYHRKMDHGHWRYY